jgi:hypothetical protein
MGKRNRTGPNRHVQLPVQVPVEDIPWDDPRFKRLSLLFLALFIIMTVVAAWVRLYLVAGAVLVFGLALFALFGWAQIRAFWRWLRGLRTS